ncbi:MAG: 50S ribosomal protein L18 [Candidatus Bathyarchaeia archaeon]
MARGPSYNVPFRRRREGKTDYQLRQRLILSGLPRLVTRKTQKHIIVQLIKSTAAGDEVLTSAHSIELRKKYGWLGDLSNIPAAYLTGLLCGYRSMVRGVKEAVLDIGLQSPSKGARVFAVLKGFIDAGVEVPHNEEVLPDENRIAGKHIEEYAAKLSSDQDSYSRMFSQYLSRGLSPQKISENFSSVKEKIIIEFEKSAKTQ